MNVKCAENPNTDEQISRSVKKTITSENLENPYTDTLFSRFQPILRLQKNLDFFPKNTKTPTRTNFSPRTPKIKKGIRARPRPRTCAHPRTHTCAHARIRAHARARARLSPRCQITKGDTLPKTLTLTGNLKTKTPPHKAFSITQKP